MAGEGGIEGILRTNAEGCVRFLTSLLKQRSGVLDDRWKGKVTSMVRLARSSTAGADLQVEIVREIGRNVERVGEFHTVS
jgi:hypothetical protein